MQEEQVPPQAGCRPKGFLGRYESKASMCTVVACALHDADRVPGRGSSGIEGQAAPHCTLHAAVDCRPALVLVA